jgi:hypothetical protein
MMELETTKMLSSSVATIYLCGWRSVVADLKMAARDLQTL